MAFNYPVKYINNSMRGAPVLSGTAGTMITLLNTFLIDGWGTTTALSVSVSDGVGTAMLTPGETFEEGAVVLLAGATPSLLNGEARVLTSSSTSITFETDAPDGVATGTITIKYAPVGQWEHAFPATSTQAVYRSTDVTGSRFYYRVIDIGTTTCRVRGYETMTDADTGLGLFPAEGQISGGGFWPKSLQANASAIPYDFFADSQFLLVGVAFAILQSAVLFGSSLRGFGQLIALSPGGDAFVGSVSVFSSAAVVSLNTSAHNGAYDSFKSGNDSVYLARGNSGIGGSVAAETRNYVGSNGSAIISGADSHLGGFPSVVDGQLKLSRRFVAGADNTPRANLPGVLWIPQSGVISEVAPRDIIVGGGEFAGRRLYAMARAQNTAATPTGILLVDVTGPWR